MGVPAIASNIYGISDAIISNSTGILHEQKNVQNILICLNVFLNEPLKSKKLGINARKRVIKYFDADLISHYWLNFYLKLL
jgi:glycosyltransferase involved in cell wall biosynthesis